MSSSRFGKVTNHGSGNVFSSQGDESRQTVTLHGTDEAAEPAAESATARPEPTSGADLTRNVFVVHGRDEQVRLAMFGLLQQLDLRPLEWEDLVKATGQTSPFLGEVVAAAPDQAQAALVLLTPDDLVRLHPDLLAPDDLPDERYLTGQARPNVLLELGMVLMAYPERTLIVEIGSLRRIADLAGRNVIRFDGSAAAVGKIVTRLKAAGCAVNDNGSGWRDLSPFARLAAYRRDRDT